MFFFRYIVVLMENAGMINAPDIREVGESEGYPGNRDHGTGHPGLPTCTPEEAGYCSWGLLPLQRNEITFSPPALDKCSLTSQTLNRGFFPPPLCAP